LLLHSTAVAQWTPQPVFTELFTYDPAAPSQLLGKWLISSQLDTKLQPLRVGVVEDSSGVPVGRVTVQEGDGRNSVPCARCFSGGGRKGSGTIRHAIVSNRQSGSGNERE
jgi:hypothetical protein